MTESRDSEEGVEAEVPEMPDRSEPKAGVNHDAAALQSSGEILSALVGQGHSRRVRRYSRRPRKDLSENIDPSDATRKYRAELEKEHLKQRQQANRHREWFFKFALALVAMTVLSSSSIALIGTFVGSALDSPTTVAFVSGLSVQTIGVLWVIAKYLFSEPHKLTSEGP